ncbi:MAG TPA: CopD family protein [Nitrospiria bacterium]|nr:CopD family protein [Nitrospiria bacterium]
MTGHTMYFHVLVQWLTFLGVAFLVGGVVFRSTVLNRSLRVLGSGSPDLERAQATGQRDLKRWMGRWLILLFIVSIVDLIIRAEMMSRKPFSAVLPMLPLIISQTHAGKVWIAKMAILCLLIALWFFIKKDRARPGQQVLWLLASAGLCLTVSLSGHAADKGDFSIAVAADWLHMMAISSWVGGLVPLRFLLPKIWAPLDEKKRIPFQTASIHRFSWLAARCVGVLILTGVYAAWLHLRTVSNLVGTPYGITLLFKLAFVVPMLALGALSRYYIRPALQTLAGEPVRVSFIGKTIHRVVCLLGGDTGSADHRMLELRYSSARIAVVHFQVFVALQCLLAVAVLGLTALLTQTSPPNLTNFAAPDSSSDMQNKGM